MALKKKKPAKKKVAKKKAIKRKIIKKKPAKKKPIKKVTKKKVVKKTTQKSGKKIIKESGEFVGIITHYFPQVQAAVVKLKAPLSVGDKIKVKGHTTDFSEIVASLQMDRTPITNAKKGQEIGLLVSSRVRQHDKVYKI